MNVNKGENGGIDLFLIDIWVLFVSYPMLWLKILPPRLIDNKINENEMIIQSVQRVVFYLVEPALV